MATNGNWTLEKYDVEDAGRRYERYRLIHDGHVMVEDIPDLQDLTNLFAFSLMEEGFTALTRSYHDKTLPEDDAELDYLGPCGSPVAGCDILMHAGGGIANLPMDADTCRNLALPDGSTYGQGVTEFRRGYQSHAHHLSPEERRQRRERGAVAHEQFGGLAAEDVEFLRALAHMEGHSADTTGEKANWQKEGL